MDAVKRSCTVSALCGNYHVKLTMLFPESYPNNAPPTFQFSHETNIDEKTETKLLKVSFILQCTSVYPCLPSSLLAPLLSLPALLPSFLPFSPCLPTSPPSSTPNFILSLYLPPLSSLLLVERSSSVVECRTRNRVSPGSNPPLLPFRRLDIFVISTVVPVDSAV